MATYETFLSTPTVESCVPAAKLTKEILASCGSCEIANCTRSYTYKASLFFWHEYNKQQQINSFLSSIAEQRTPAEPPKKEGFVYVQVQKVRKNKKPV